MSDKIGLFTGSFDPMTNGHLDIIERASKLFDKLYVGVFYNPHKQGFLPVENRKRAARKAVAHLDNVEVLASHDQLVVDVARRLELRPLSVACGMPPTCNRSLVLITTIINWLQKSKPFTYIVAQSIFISALQPWENFWSLVRRFSNMFPNSVVEELEHEEKKLDGPYMSS